MCCPVVIVGLGLGERSTWEMVRCTNMVKAQQVKAGILLRMKKLTTRLNLIMDGQTWWAIQVSCYPLNLGIGHLGSIQILTLVHLHHLRTMSHHHGELVFYTSFLCSS